MEKSINQTLLNSLVLVFGNVTVIKIVNYIFYGCRVTQI